MTRKSQNRKKVSLTLRLARVNCYLDSQDKELKRTIKNASTKNTSKRAQKQKQDQIKSLRKAFEVPDDLNISQASTSHNEGQREVRSSLDNALKNKDITEALYKIGSKRTLTRGQLSNIVKEQKELIARSYEQDQKTIENTMDDLANLMNDA